MNAVIISFCGHCGCQLRSGLGMRPVAEQKCENCNGYVSQSRDRCEGTFSAADAERLTKLLEVG